MRRKRRNRKGRKKGEETYQYSLHAFDITSFGGQNFGRNALPHQVLRRGNFVLINYKRISIVEGEGEIGEGRGREREREGKGEYRGRARV